MWLEKAADKRLDRERDELQRTHLLSVFSHTDTIPQEAIARLRASLKHRRQNSISSVVCQEIG